MPSPPNNALPTPAPDVWELAGTLDLVPIGAVVEVGDDWRRRLLDVLTPRIEQWLRSDRARLAHALYRMDVDEALVSDALADDPRELGPRRVAQLMLERVEQKVRNRWRYEQMLKG